jgi:hypothetical protein
VKALAKLLLVDLERHPVSETEEAHGTARPKAGAVKGPAA